MAQSYPLLFVLTLLIIMMLQPRCCSNLLQDLGRLKLRYVDGLDPGLAASPNLTPLQKRYYKAAVAEFSRSPNQNLVKVMVESENPEYFLLSPAPIAIAGTKGRGKIYWRHEVLGTGGRGTVYRATDLSTGRTVALKHLRVTFRHEGKAEYKVIKALGLAEGDYICKRMTNMGGNDVIPMRYYPGRNLETELKDPESRFSKVYLYEQAKNAIRKLHIKGYCHGDSNTQNFIVNPESGSIAMIDFGYAHVWTNLEDVTSDYEKLARNVLNEAVGYKSKEAIEAAQRDLQSSLDHSYFYNLQQ